MTVTLLSPESAAMATAPELAPSRDVTKLNIGDRIAVLPRRILDAEVVGITTYCPPDHGERHHVIRWQAGRASGEFGRRDGERVTLAIDPDKIRYEIADLTEEIRDFTICAEAAGDGTPLPDAPDMTADDYAREISDREGQRDQCEELLACLAAAFLTTTEPVALVPAA